MKSLVKPVARLSINEESISIKSFSFEAKANQLGASLSIQLANPNLSIPPNAEVTFEIGYKRDGNESTIILLTNGRLVGRQANIEYRGDTLSISAVNLLADRWRLAPRKPVVIYDQDKIKFESEQERGLSDVVDRDGNPIEYEIIKRKELKLKTVLDYVYITGCGFKKVITNIENFPVRRADFPINSSFHNSVLKFTSMYEPVYFADDNDILYILNINGTLPTGIANATRSIEGANLKRLSVSKPGDNLINAILLTYSEESRESGDDEWPKNATERTIETEVTNGAPFSNGFAKQIIGRTFKEFHDDPNDPDRVTRTIPYKKVVASYAGDQLTGLPVMISRQTIIELWSNNWRLRTGYDEINEARVPVPFGDSGALSFREVQRKTNRVTWINSLYNPKEFFKAREVTEVTGEVLIEGTATPEGAQLATSAVPILEATTNRQVTQGGFQSIIQGRISTEIIELHDTGTNQVDGIKTIIDHLVPSLRADVIEQNIAQRSVNISDLSTITMLLRNLSSEGIIGNIVPQALNAGDVPFDLAIEKANQILNRKSEERTGERVEIELPYFDPILRRGSIRKISARTISEPTLYLIEGHDIKGINLDTSKGNISQTAQAVIVVND